MSDPDRTTRPSVLVLHTDQQRWDALGANGNDDVHTPNLDRLAENGVNCTHAFVNAPVCMPSRASFMTGRYPSRLRTLGNGVRLPEGVRTFPQYLSGYGYATASIGKLHFLPHSNRDHTRPHPDYGFDHLEVSDEPGCYPDAYRAWVRKHAPDQLDDVSVGLPPATAAYHERMGIDDGIGHPEPRFEAGSRAFPGDPEYTHAAFVARRTMQYLRDHRDDRFLCFAGFYSPHSPWVAPRRFLDRYDPDELSIPAFPERLNAEREALSDDPEDPSTPTFTDEELRDVRRGYYAMVSEVDHWIGEILDTLESLGRLEETLIVFTADHGEDLGQHLRYGKGFPGWDSISRVPLLVHWPDGLGRPGRTVDDLVELVDLLPTVLEAAGVQVPSDLHGRSLLPALAGDDRIDRDAALMESRDGHAIRTDRFRYAIAPDGTERLYDLEADPEEFHDVSDADDYADALASCRRRLARRKTALDVAAERDLDAKY